MSTTFWLSFSDNKFLGAVVVDADTFTEAVAMTHLFDCNPGGEVLGIEITKEMKDSNSLYDEKLAAYPRLKLLSKGELDSIDMMRAIE